MVVVVPSPDDDDEDDTRARKASRSPRGDCCKTIGVCQLTEF